MFLRDQPLAGGTPSYGLYEESFVLGRSSDFGASPDASLMHIGLSTPPSHCLQPTHDLQKPANQYLLPYQNFDSHNYDVKTPNQYSTHPSRASPAGQNHQPRHLSK